MGRQRWQDWANMLVGLACFIAPWVLRDSMPRSAALASAIMWDFCLAGVLVAAIAAAALFAFRNLAEWTNLGLGLWLLLSPWALEFTASQHLASSAVVFGTLVMLFALWALIAAPDRRRGAG